MSDNDIRRYGGNPIISIDDVKPSADGMQVVGVFNCGGTRLAGKTYLVCRTAEICIPEDEDHLLVPSVDRNGGKRFTSFDRNDPDLDFSDARLIMERKTGRVVALTSFSSFRLATSDDGFHFSIADKPCIEADPLVEEWGMEDPRVTKLEGRFYLTYSSVSRNGVGVSLAVTDDFSTFTALGMILPPTNKDTVLFPRKINGTYRLLHRPSPEGKLGTQDIWIADSPDLIHWGNHRHLCSCRDGQAWERQKIGAGAPPILIPEGWLVLYHGVDDNERYSMGVLLLDKDDPSIVRSRSLQPVFEPETTYEKSGFFSETVFPCTAFPSGRSLIVYYGAADNSICRVDIPMEALLA